MVPSDEYFKILAQARPMIEQYNKAFEECFDSYLREQNQETLMKVFALKQHDMSEPAGNCYGHINVLYKICEIAIKEIGVGYTPITSGARTFKEAIDKYHKICFMKRRAEFLGDDPALTDEARNYILSEKISPIALSYIVKNELGGVVEKAISFWQSVYRNAGMEREAMLLVAL